LRNEWDLMRGYRSLAPRPNSRRAIGHPPFQNKWGAGPDVLPPAKGIWKRNGRRQSGEREIQKGAELSGSASMIPPPRLPLGMRGMRSSCQIHWGRYFLRSTAGKNSEGQKEGGRNDGNCPSKCHFLSLFSGNSVVCLPRENAIHRGPAK
jgi:hypothetical protein